MKPQNQFLLWVFFMSLSMFSNPLSVHSASASPAQNAPLELKVQIHESQLEVSEQIVRFGRIRFRIQNQGMKACLFAVSQEKNGHFKTLKETKSFAPGMEQAITLSLSPGTYRLSCKLIETEGENPLEHKKQDMPILLTVVRPLKIGGSGADLGTMRLLAAAIKQSHPKLLVEVPPSLGSGGGIKAVLSGRLDLGLSTRPLKAVEKEKGAREIPYAKTPFLFATGQDNLQSNLNHQDIVNIYNRSRTTWDDGSTIRIVLRPDSDSDIRILRRHFPEIDPAPFTGKTWRGIPIAFTDQKSADLTQTIPGAIGMATLSLILGEKRPLKALAINGVPPTPQALADGSYPISKMLSFILRPKPDPLVEIFLDFVRSEQGKAILQETGHLVLKQTDG